MDGLPVVTSLEFMLNLLAILVSLVAAAFWVKLIRRIQISSTEDRGWVWIFMAVIMILLLNISGVILLFSESEIKIGTLNKIFKFTIGEISLLSTLARSIIAISITIGSYLLLRSINNERGFKFKLAPVIPVAEEGSSVAARFDLTSGASYLIKEYHGAKYGAVDVFLDLVMHNEAGLYITRKYPPKLREDLGLRKTPIFWLSRDKDYEYTINPSDFISLTEVIKEFIKKSDKSVVFLEGIEYLIVQNDFDSVIKFLESLNDSVSKSNSKLIIAIDPSALDSQHMHILERELKEFTIK